MMNRDVKVLRGRVASDKEMVLAAGRVLHEVHRTKNGADALNGPPPPEVLAFASRIVMEFTRAMLAPPPARYPHSDPKTDTTEENLPPIPAIKTKKEKVKRENKKIKSTAVYIDRVEDRRPPKSTKKRSIGQRHNGGYRRCLMELLRTTNPDAKNFRPAGGERGNQYRFVTEYKVGRPKVKRYKAQITLKDFRLIKCGFTNPIEAQKYAIREARKFFKFSS